MARVSPPNIGKSMAEVTILCPNCRKPNQRNEQTIQKARFCQHCGHDVVLNNPGPRYYITRVIKEGGQGAVYEAISDDWRTYAVKEMLDRFTDPKERIEATQRFEHESELLTRVRHPRIPRVYASFEDDGRHYLAMEFVRGEDLEQIVERDGAIPEAKVLPWADQVCDVLDYLHKSGLIYRDMKPSNVMVERQGGGIKIVDFGIAKVFQHTERGTQIGTPGYAPPEQYQGLATIESDIYALGATLHHLLSGRDPRDEPPFSFPPLRELKPQISQRTADAVARALQMRPEDRFQSVAEFRAALRPLAATPSQVRVAPAAQPQAARPATPATNQRQPAVVPPPVALARPPTPRPTQPLQQATPQYAPQTAPQPGIIRRFIAFVFRTLLVLVLVAGITGATLYFAFPSVVSEYLPGLPGLQSTAVPVVPTAQPVGGSQQFNASVTFTAPANADDATIRQQMIVAYTQAAQKAKGDTTRVNTNTISTIGGAPEKVNDNPDGSATYSATVSGYIAVP